MNCESTSYMVSTPLTHHDRSTLCGFWVCEKKQSQQFRHGTSNLSQVTLKPQTPPRGPKTSFAIVQRASLKELLLVLRADLHHLLRMKLRWGFVCMWERSTKEIIHVAVRLFRHVHSCLVMPTFSYDSRPRVWRRTPRVQTPNTKNTMRGFILKSYCILILQYSRFIKLKDVIA